MFLVENSRKGPYVFIRVKWIRVLSRNKIQTCRDHVADFLNAACELVDKCQRRVGVVRDKTIAPVFGKYSCRTMFETIISLFSIYLVNFC